MINKEIELTQTQGAQKATNALRTYAYKRGRFFGYPECCIEWFFNNRVDINNITALTAQQESVHGHRGFIPCPECADKVTRKTLYKLIKNRQCRVKFPHGDTNKTASVLWRMIKAANRNHENL